MKKTIFLLAAAIALVSFASKTFTISFTEQQLNKHWQKLNAVRQIVEESNLPHQQVKFITQSIDSLQQDIAVQVQVQLADSTRKK